MKPENENIFMKLGELDYPKKAKAPDVDKKVAPKESKVYKRTMGSIHSSLEAQKIFNPMTPQTAKAPNATMVNQGTASAQDMTGNWGTPNRVK